MSSGQRLFECEDPAIWRRVYDKYWAVVKAKDARKGKNSGKLLELEKWYFLLAQYSVSIFGEKYKLTLYLYYIVFLIK